MKNDHKHQWLEGPDYDLCRVCGVPRFGDFVPEGRCPKCRAVLRGDAGGEAHCGCGREFAWYEGPRGVIFEAFE